MHMHFFYRYFFRPSWQLLLSPLNVVIQYHVRNTQVFIEMFMQIPPYESS